MDDHISHERIMQSMTSPTAPKLNMRAMSQEVILNLVNSIAESGTAEPDLNKFSLLQLLIKMSAARISDRIADYL